MGTKMTAMWVKKASTDKSRVEIADELCPGLYLRISGTGAKSWRFRYRMGGERKYMALGRWPDLSLADARDAAHGLQSRIHAGEDPLASIEESRTEREAMPTVETFCHTYLNRYAKVRKRSWRDDERYLLVDVVPFIGRLKMDEVKRRDLVKLMDRMTDRGARIAANRMYSCVRRMFRFAVERGVLESTPAQFIRIAKEKARDVHLNDEQLRDFWRKTEPCNTRGDGVRYALRFALLSLARRSEVASMATREINVEKKLWTLPAERSKNNVEHVTPLTPVTVDIIECATRPRAEYVFASYQATVGHVHKDSMTDMAHKISGGAYTVHDLRRTGTTRISGMGVKRIVVKKLLNHVDNSVDGIYDRYDYLPEKRAALEAWEAELLRIVG